jgi:tetratricopeptide (TPR) repeat protein
MDKRLDFQFSIPRPPEGLLVEMSAEEMERTLLKRLEAEKSQPIDALWQLARFYQQRKDHEKGLNCLRQALAHMPDVESKAHCVLGMGQLMEAVQDYEAAVRYYREALALEPVQTDTWYFIHNNLGFSLNTLWQFAEGERYCRNAIQIDPTRPNAFKNLGIALKGQGEYRDAAKCFVTATQVNAADGRSLCLLQELLREHPELEYEFQGDVESCRNAVEFAAQKLAEAKPVVYRGWRKHLIIWQAKLRSVGRKVRKLFSRA